MTKLRFEATTMDLLARRATTTTDYWGSLHTGHNQRTALPNKDKERYRWNRRSESYRWTNARDDSKIRKIYTFSAHIEFSEWKFLLGHFESPLVT